MKIEHIDMPVTLQYGLLVFSNKRYGKVYRCNAEVKDNRPILTNPVEITDDFIEQIESLSSKHTLPFFDPNLLASNRRKTVWYIPASNRRMFFASRKEFSFVQGIAVPQPPLVMAATKQALHVYALQADERPTPDTPLMLAPYSNVFDDNRVCLGSMRQPQEQGPHVCKEWESAFFESHFTHTSGLKKRWKAESEAQLWRDAISQGRFDPAWLRSAELKLGDFLNIFGEQP